MKSYLCIFALIIGVICSSAQDEDTNSWKHPEPISYEVLRAWHKNGGLQKYIWPKEHQADLNDDNVNEVFLGISGYGRGMTYALFTKTNKGWILLSEEIEGSHHDFEVLPEKHEGWHDFVAELPSGRGGLFEIVYTWNGQKYVQKSFHEITEKDLNKN
jgi:hypothetical protein